MLLFMVQKGWLNICEKPSVVFSCPVFALIVFSRLLWSLHVSALADIHDTPTAQTSKASGGSSGCWWGMEGGITNMFMLVFCFIL